MATRSSSLLKRSPRCCASHSRLLPVQMMLSMSSFCTKAGSAIMRPTRPRDTCRRSVHVLGRRCIPAVLKVQ